MHNLGPMLPEKSQHQSLYGTWTESHRAGHASPDAALRYQHATRDRDQLLADTLEVLRGRRAQRS